MADMIRRGGKRRGKIATEGQTGGPVAQPRPSESAATPSQTTRQAEMAKLTPEEAREKGRELLRKIFFRSGPLPMAPDQEAGK